MGWIRLDTWPEIAERLPRPLTTGEALADVRWHFYEGGGLISVDAFAARWGWFSKSGKPSAKRVRLQIRGEQWRDAFLDKTQKGKPGANEGQAEGHARGNDSNPNPTLDPTRTHNDIDESDPLPIPKWLLKWRKTAGDVPRSVTNAALAGLAAHAIEALTGRPLPRWPPSMGHGRPALNAWRRLGFAAIVDADPESRHTGPRYALGQLALLVEAAKDSPDQLFRNHIRGVRASGERWKETPRLTAGVVWRMDPPKTSGATIEDRLIAALEWHDAGRPVSDDGLALPSFDARGGEKPSAFLGDVFAARGQAVAGQTQLTAPEPEQVNQPTAVLEMLEGMRRKR